MYYIVAILAISVVCVMGAFLSKRMYRETKWGFLAPLAVSIVALLALIVICIIAVALFSYGH